MEAWQYRLIEEHEQLTYRIGKLNDYMGKANGIGRFMQHQQLLKMQLSIMQAYAVVLSERMRLHNMQSQPSKQA